MGDYFQFCGLDCGKGSVVACTVNERPTNLKRFAATYKAQTYYSTLSDLQRLARVAETYFIEPTGVYYRIFYEYLLGAGKQVLLVPSRQVRSFCDHHGLFNKTDRIDPAGIVAYGIEKLGDDRAFIQIHNQELRELCSKLTSLQDAKSKAQQLLGQRLSYEVPEWVRCFEQSDRDWLNPTPPALWRYIAGEKVYNQKRRDRDLNETHGRGLSDYSKHLAEQLCTYERWEYRLELELAEVLKTPEFEPYHQAFDQFVIPNKIRAHLLTIAYPFDRFLLPDGRMDQFMVNSGLKSNRKETKRNKSLQSFKLYNGLGMVLAESGNSSQWVAGGAAFIRSQWWRLVKVVVVMRRPKAFPDFLNKQKEVFGNHSPTCLELPIKQHWLNAEIVEATAKRFEISKHLAESWIHYQELKTIKPIHDHQVCLVAGRMCTNLFRLLRQNVAIRTH